VSARSLAFPPLPSLPSFPPLPHLPSLALKSTAGLRHYWNLRVRGQHTCVNPLPHTNAALFSQPASALLSLSFHFCFIPCFYSYVVCARAFCVSWCMTPCHTRLQLHHRSPRQRARCHQEEVSTKQRSHVLRVSVKMILSALATAAKNLFLLLKHSILVTRRGWNIAAHR
jgi:hypothetical protein